MLAQDARRGGQHGRLVVHDQHRGLVVRGLPAGARPGRWLAGGPRGLSGHLHGREVTAERGAAARRGLDRHAAVGLGHDAVHRGQPEAGAFTPAAWW